MNLTQLNLKIAEDALDDAVERLQECQRELAEALRKLLEYRLGRN